MIDLTCDACAETFQVPDSLAGGSDACPSCGRRVAVPSPGEVPAGVIRELAEGPAEPPAAPPPAAPMQRRDVIHALEMLRDVRAEIILGAKALHGIQKDIHFIAIVVLVLVVGAVLAFLLRLAALLPAAPR